MRTIDAQTLFESVNALATGTAKMPSTRDWYTFRSFLDISLREAWNSEWWPELMRVDSRTPDADNQLPYTATAPATFDPVGDVFDVKNMDPTTSRNWTSLEWTLINDAVQLMDDATTVYLQYRIPCPTLNGTFYDDATAYAVGDQVYFDDGGTIRGNFWNCIVATTAGQHPNALYSDGGTPPANIAKWELVEIPAAFRGFLEWSAYAKSLPTYAAGERNAERATALAMADNYLQLETDKLYRQQGQAPPMPIRTY